MPEVSVIIPAFGAGGFIARAVRSLKAQTLTDFEAILVDDASSDDTLGAFAAAAGEDARFRAVRQEVNAGPSAARNRAIDLARGRWLAMLDADDLMAAERLRRLVDVGEASGFDIVADNLFVVDDPEAPQAGFPLWRDLGDGAAYSVDLRTFVLENRPSRGPRALGYMKPLVRSDWRARFDVRYPPELTIAEDFHFVAEALALGAKLGRIADPLYLYWRRTASLSRAPSPEPYRRIAEAGRAFAQRHHARLDGGERRALARRQRELEDLVAWLEARERPSPADAFARIARQPGSLRYAADAAVGKVVRMLRARSPG